MTLPVTRTIEKDGAIGNATQLSRPPMVVVGPCSAGPVNKPRAFAKIQELTAEHGDGPAVELAAYALETYRRPVILIRTEAGEAHSYGAIDNSGITGTAVASIDNPSTAPADDYEVRVLVVAGGTVGADGITYRLSYDAGRTYSPPLPLGIATTIPVPGASGIDVTLGDLNPGDVIAFDCWCATPTSGELSTALEALGVSARDWEFAVVAAPIDLARAAVVSAWLEDLHDKGKHHWAAGNFRAPNAGESEANYRTAFETFRNNFASTSVSIAAGTCQLYSPISRRQYRRPAVFPVAALVQNVSEEIDVAAVDSKYPKDLGPLPGVSVRDDDGNPMEGYHDEDANPGLDDLRATTLRSWSGYSGTYVGNCRLMSSDSSDFQFVQHRRVMNIARKVLNEYMIQRLSKPLEIDRKTGFVREADLLNIEAEAMRRLDKALTSKASAWQFTLSRTDPILNPPYPLTGEFKMIPLGYPKEITVTVAYTRTLDGGV